MSKTNPIPAMCCSCGSACEVPTSADLLTALCSRCVERDTTVEAAETNAEPWDSGFWKEAPTESQEPSTTPKRERTFFDVVVTTGDIKKDYQIVGPVYFHISNKGFFKNDFRKYEEEHKRWLAAHYNRGQMQETKKGWIALLG